MTLKSGSEVTYDHLKWYHSIDYVWFFYYCPIVILSVRRTVFETFEFKNALILNTGLMVREGH